QPLPGTNYYRLKQVDLSGAVTYTKAVSVNVNMAEPGLLVMGNPIRTGTIKLTTQNLTDASFQLMSLSGQTVAIRTDAQANGDVTLTPVSPPATGLYLLTVKSGATNLVRKILID
ncbi:MAG: T9SS type A sorting domain-containing protein, partial [Cytophagaceae bacterium]